MRIRLALFITIILLTFFSAKGQKTIGEIFFNGRAVQLGVNDSTFFEFNEFDSTLTSSALQYLDKFATSHRDSVLNGKTFIIRLSPGITDTERDQDNQILVKRINAIASRLSEKYGIIAFTIQIRETIAHDGCVGILSEDKSKNKLPRKERKKLKRDIERIQTND